MSSITRHAFAVWPLMSAEVFIFGTAAFAALLAPSDTLARRGLIATLAGLWRLLALAIIVLSPVLLLLDSANMAGLPLTQAVAVVPDVLRETHVGRMWMYRLIVAAALLIAALPRNPNRWRAALIGILAAALLLLVSLSSHAIDKGAVTVGADFVHQIAAGLWAGSLLAFWLATRAKLGPDWEDRAAPRVSKVAGWCVAGIVVSGAWIAYRMLGLDLDHLLYSTYGHTLLAKIALFALVVSIGGYNRYRVLPQSSMPARRLLLRDVGWECILLVGVLWIAALLANSPPAH